MGPLACPNLSGPEQSDGDLRLFRRYVLRIRGKTEQTEKKILMGCQRRL